MPSVRHDKKEESRLIPGSLLVNNWPGWNIIDFIVAAGVEGRSFVMDTDTGHGAWVQDLYVTESHGSGGKTDRVKILPPDLTLYAGDDDGTDSTWLDSDHLQETSSVAARPTTIILGEDEQKDDE